MSADFHNQAISARDLSIGYKLSRKSVKTVGSGLSFELSSGEIVSLLGRNGAGKSTLIKTLCGFVPALGGSVTIMGREISSFTKDELARKVGVVLTEKVSAGGVTVRELVYLGRYPHTGFFARLTEADNDAVDKALAAVGIVDKADCHLSEMSDGEKQKAFVAKALAQECPLIILDEPTAFLDITSRIELMQLLSRLAHDEGKTILISTHDLDLSLRYSDRLLILAGGKSTTSGPSIVSGTPAELVSSGVISDTFGQF